MTMKQARRVYARLHMHRIDHIGALKLNPPITVRQLGSPSFREWARSRHAPFDQLSPKLRAVVAVVS